MNNRLRQPNWYMEEAKNTLPQYFQPWINAGKAALPNVYNQFAQLASDPAAFYNKFAGGYQKSPGYDFRLQQALQGSNQAAAAGGMAGSPMSQQWGAEISENMANKDFNDYMDRISQLYGAGLSGEAGLSEQGLKAGMGLGEDISSIIAHQAQMAQWKDMYEKMQKMAEGQQGSNFWGGLLGGLGTLGGAYFGGLPGAAVGGQVGSQVGRMF